MTTVCPDRLLFNRFAVAMQAMRCEPQAPDTCVVVGYDVAFKFKPLIITKEAKVSAASLALEGPPPEAGHDPSYAEYILKRRKIAPPPNPWKLASIRLLLTVLFAFAAACPIRHLGCTFWDVRFFFSSEPPNTCNASRHSRYAISKSKNLCHQTRADNVLK